ncbi:MAG: AAA family ATPase [Phototrophicaceae bacterium]
MYINRIIMRNVRHLKEVDICLRNDWTEEPLQSVLFTGVNGSGKTTLLRVVAALWENFGSWLRLGKSLKATQQGQEGLLTSAGLVAIELIGFQSSPIWLFMASTQEDWDVLQTQVNDNDAQFIGEIRGARGRPQFVGYGYDTWFRAIGIQKEKLELGEVNSVERLPNLVFLEAETRTLISAQRGDGSKIQPESLYQWFVTYAGQDRWAGHIESMLRNLKIRDARQFAETVASISNFLGEGKRITDFDDDLRLRVQFGKHKTHSHLIDELSSGEKQCLIMIFMASRWLMEGGILLIDEPDLHLHVSLQRQVIHHLEQIVRQRNGQLLITSHSPTMWEEFGERQRVNLGGTIHEQV